MWKKASQPQASVLCRPLASKWHPKPHNRNAISELNERGRGEMVGVKGEMNATMRKRSEINQNRAFIYVHLEEPTIAQWKSK